MILSLNDSESPNKNMILGKIVELKYQFSFLNDFMLNELFVPNALFMFDKTFE